MSFEVSKKTKEDKQLFYYNSGRAFQFLSLKDQAVDMYMKVDEIDDITDFGNNLSKCSKYNQALLK